MAYKRISPQPVVEGGTGIQTTTAYGVLCGGTTATGAFQNAGTGMAGQVLTSTGALPTWGANGTNPAASCSFFAYNNADVANYFTDGVFKTIQFPATLYNVGGDYNTGTYTFTAPNTGYYLFSVSIGIAAINSNRNFEGSLAILATAGLFLMSNCSPYAIQDTNTNSIAVNQTTLIKMTAGDTAVAQYLLHEVNVSNCTLSGHGGVLGAGYWTTFSGYQVA